MGLFTDAETRKDFVEHVRICILSGDAAQSGDCCMEAGCRKFPEPAADFPCRLLQFGFCRFQKPGVAR